MGIVREPLDVDFFVDPTPPTEKELELISQFIRDFKAKQSRQNANAISKARKARKKSTKK
jgi:hypothetical protein